MIVMNKEYTLCGLLKYLVEMLKFVLDKIMSRICKE